MTMHEEELRCPDCDGQRFVTAVIETVRVTYEIDVLSYDGGPYVRELGEDDRELIDTDRDDARIICSDCGAEFDDPDDIQSDREDD